jgi:hypothetical protein
MGWSVGWALPPEADLIDEILLAAGKALYLANRFEAKCSLVLRTANLVDVIKTDPVASLEDIASRLPAGQMLGGTLSDLQTRTDMGVTPEVHAALTRARLARNYIAHEGAAALGDLYGYGVQYMLDALRVLRSNVADLAEADNIVSRAVRGGLHLAGLDVLLRRIGRSVQVPARRAAERDEDQIARWREETWPVIKARRRTWAPGSASRTSLARA